MNTTFSCLNTNRNFTAKSRARAAKMRLVQLAVLHIILVSALFTGTSGKQTCWFHKKTRTGEECRGTMPRLNAAIARYVGGTTDAWACTRHWTRVNHEANRFCACPLPVHSDDIHSCPYRRGFIKSLTGSGIL